MSQTEESLPGLVLYMVEHALQPCSGEKFKGTGLIKLRAEVHDFDVWDQVVDRLDGMTVYQSLTLMESVMASIQRRAEKKTAAALQTMEEARVRVEELEAQLSFVLADNERLKQQMSVLVRERDELQEVVDIQDQTLEQKC